MKNLKLMLTALLFTQSIFAQERKVSGVVMDSTGFLIPGVNIIVEGTTGGTQTGFDGRFSINALPNDTLVFNQIEYKTYKLIANKNELIVRLQYDERIAGVGFIPPVPRSESANLPITKVTAEDIKKANDPKYHFKKNADSNLFVIYISELTTYDFNKEDLEFQKKYNIQYSLVGNLKSDYLTRYNKLTFKYLDRNYQKIWQTDIRKDAVGLKKYLK